MSVPRVFDIGELTEELLRDLRQASQSYWYSEYEHDFIRAFDELQMVPERADLIHGFLMGTVPVAVFADRIWEWLLQPASSTWSLDNDRIEALASALESIRSDIAVIPKTVGLDEIGYHNLRDMAASFKTLDECPGVGPTIASKILSALRPNLFPSWDSPIAMAYGFTLNAAGYHQFLISTRAIARKVIKSWACRSSRPLMYSLEVNDRRWIPPLIKVIGEWNWIRITRNIPLHEPTEKRGMRPGKQPVKDALRQLMNDIDEERVGLTKLNSGAAVHVDFLTDSGWKLRVFNDVGDWDFLEFAVDPEGNELDYEDMYSGDPIESPVKHLLWGIRDHNDPDPAFPDGG